MNCWGNTKFSLKNNRAQIKQVVLANGMMFALNDEGRCYSSGFSKGDVIDQPEDFREDVKHISGMRSLCAVKSNGDLGCWNTKTLVFDEILPK